MLIAGKNFSAHRPWIIFVTLATVAAGAWYVAACVTGTRWPGGSSVPGLAFGTLGGLIILFEFALWPRKKLRAWRLGRAKVWMRAHIWLGLLTVPLILLHSGFMWGGSLSTILAWLFIVVILSGVFGLALQQYLPRMMLEQVESETIYTQIGNLTEQFALNAEDQVLAVCGPAPDGPPALRSQLKQEIASTAYVTVGAVRTVGGVQGKVLETNVITEPIRNGDVLRGAFYDTVAPYLLKGAPSGSPLQSTTKRRQFFDNLKARVDPAAYPLVDNLNSLCQQRGELDLQSRLQFWLHSWLCIHLPLSFALVLLMFVHGYVALKYW